MRSEAEGGIISITSTTAEDMQAAPSPKGDWITYTFNLRLAYLPQIWTVSASETLPIQLRE